MSWLPFATRLLHAHRFENHRQTLQAMDDHLTREQDYRVRAALDYVHGLRHSRIEVFHKKGTHWIATEQPSSKPNSLASVKDNGRPSRPQSTPDTSSSAD